MTKPPADYATCKQLNTVVVVGVNTAAAMRRNVVNLVQTS